MSEPMMVTCEDCGQTFMLTSKDPRDAKNETHVILCDACNVRGECVIVKRTESGW